MSEPRSLNFLEEIIEADLAAGKYPDGIHTRFPPEPNGYLHIGHATSICLNFGLAKKYGGKCNLRFDDTNPSTEETEYVDSILGDVRWLGFEWDELHYTSDYFETLYQYAVKLVVKGLAYVDDSTAEEMAASKGDIGIAGTNSVYRDRSVAENRQLFEEMRAGKYADGSRVLRAKIDMAHANLLMRDPIIYRIKHASHHRTGDAWCIYPMYDFAHGQSDSLEEITHSICTLEFIHHRPLYNWFIEQLEIFPSRQYEFARRSVSYMITSKRRLLQLVQEGWVSGWDDPRMPTISGLRRRGYTPESLRHFADLVGIAKRENLTEIELLEFSIREHLNKIATRTMAVLDPIKLVITNYPQEQVEYLEAENNPEDASAGTRQLPFSNTLYIERDDFMEEPTKKYFRLGPGLMVRLKNAYIIRCDDFIKDEEGRILELRCSYFPESKSGADTSNLKVKGTIHWLCAQHAKEATVNMYDRLFTVPNPAAEEGKFQDYINPKSLVVLSNAKIEAPVADAIAGDTFQFMRKGYFVADKDTRAHAPIFNLTVGLKDSWAKEQQKQAAV